MFIRCGELQGVSSNLAKSSMVGGWATPLKNMSSSIGMMTFPIYWENKIDVPNHQPAWNPPVFC